MTKEGLH